MSRIVTWIRLTVQISFDLSKTVMCYMDKLCNKWWCPLQVHGGLPIVDSLWLVYTLLCSGILKSNDCLKMCRYCRCLSWWGHRCHHVWWWRWPGRQWNKFIWWKLGWPWQHGIWSPYSKREWKVLDGTGQARAEAWTETGKEVMFCRVAFRSRLSIKVFKFVGVQRENCRHKGGDSAQTKGWKTSRGYHFCFEGLVAGPL